MEVFCRTCPDRDSAVCVLTPLTRALSLRAAKVVAHTLEGIARVGEGFHGAVEGEMPLEEHERVARNIVACIKTHQDLLREQR